MQLFRERKDLLHECLCQMVSGQSKSVQNDTGWNSRPVTVCCMHRPDGVPKDHPSRAGLEEDD